MGEGRNFEDVRTPDGRKGVRALLKLTGSCYTGAKNGRREFLKKLPLNKKEIGVGRSKLETFDGQVHLSRACVSRARMQAFFVFVGPSQ